MQVSYCIFRVVITERFIKHKFVFFYMTKTSYHQKNPYIVFPSKPEIVYIKFPVYNLLFQDEDMPFKLDKIASRDIASTEFPSRSIFIGGKFYTTEYTGKQNAEGVYWFIPLFNREPVDPVKVGKNMRKGLENYLKPTKTLDSNHELVIEIAHEIKNGVGNKYRDNAYVLGKATNDWIEGNITYTLFPHNLIRQVALTINLLEDRTNAYEILRHSFTNIKEDVLKRIALNCHLQRNMSDIETAKHLMTQAKDIWNTFNSPWRDEELKQVYKGGIGPAKELINQINNTEQTFRLNWTTEELKASKTLEEKSSKCVGIANTYVALLRAMGVPSRTIDGYFVNEGGLEGGAHAWAALHIPGFGWKEADPTGREYVKFSPYQHKYNFFDKMNDSPIFYFIGEGESNLKVKEAINLIKTKRKEGIGKKDELMKKALKYLKRFQ